MSQATIQFEVFERGNEVTWKELDPGGDPEMLENAIFMKIVCGDGPFWVGFFEPARPLGTLPPRHPQLLYLIDRKGQFVSFLGGRMPISGIYFTKVRPSCQTKAS